jgi:hypothetical protein
MKRKLIWIVEVLSSDGKLVHSQAYQEAYDTKRAAQDAIKESEFRSAYRVRRYEDTKGKT